MYVERLDIEGFRNCCESVEFDPTLTLLLGENDAGKSNIVDALRLVLNAEPGTPRLRPQLSDFTRAAGGRRTCEEFAITVVLAGLSVVEQGRFALALSPGEGYAKARIGLRARIGPDERVAWYRCGGDFDSPDVEHRALNAVQHTYLSPLRDAARDLQPGRSNRLARLLYGLTPEQADRDRLVRVAEKANSELASHPQIRRAVDRIQEVLNGMTPDGFRQESDIAFADAEFIELVPQLLARLGEREVAESGLGNRSLLQMAVLLAHLGEADAKAAPLSLLLIEEPEAHLHPQLQEPLLRHLQAPNGGGASRQVIATTNSPHLAAAAELNRLVVITRPRSAARASAHTLAAIEMPDEDRAHVRRFLEATSAGALFGRGVILVEGICEHLLLPHFARLVERDLTDAGVTVVNSGGLPLAQFARLFGAGGLPIPCAVVADDDSDPAAADVDNPRLQPVGRTETLRALRGGSVDVFVAGVTLEWEIAFAQPRAPLLLETLRLIDPQGASDLAARADLSAAAWAKRFSERLPSRAAFAQELAAKLEAGCDLVVPAYLRSAIEHATSSPRLPPQGEDQHGDAP